MGRYSGTLHKLIDSACTSNTKTKWNQVLNYLEGHTVGSNNSENPDFDSPLPPYTSPSVELEVELFDQQGPKREDFPLKIAIKLAPSEVIAALCHLGPEATRMADSRERLPIHWACRRSSDDPETDKILKILAKCNPDSLLHRDDGGRTPLHWLFWYHAPSRSPTIVKFFCQKIHVDKVKAIEQPKTKNERYPLPEVPSPSGKNEIPPSAVIVPDSRHGALPLHYAVMQGATKDALKALIAVYPSSLSAGDRRGRTALAWYLGAGHLIDNKKHICGESNDPNATPWWYVKLSASVIQLLVNSKVARLVDDMGRTPLHWACHFYARSTHALNSSSLLVKAFQTLEDNNIGAVTTKDCDGKTPLHVLFDGIADLQEHDYKRQLSNRTLRDNIDLEKGGPVAFIPPKELVELLLKSPDADGQDQGFRFDPGRDERSSASYVEDDSGFLPLHTALRVATSPEIIQLLIQSNPTSLVHTSEEFLQTPLVHAFCSPYTAPLQPSQTFELLMAAYVTSRHGTFMDGRLALKMEDAIGTYPIHYACQNEASIENIRHFVEKFPRCALFQNADGDLPVHCVLSQENLFEPPENGVIRGASLSNPMGLLTDKEVAWQKKVKRSYQEKIRLLLKHLVSPQHLKITSSAHGMTPLHIAVAFDAVPYDMAYRMLDTYPEAARLSTTMEGYEFSCLDFHELHKNESEDEDQWNAIRELLFSFYPLLDSYRRKDELLEACVKLIRSEVTGNGSYHLQQIKDSKVKTSVSIDLSETLSSIVVPAIDCAYRPRAAQQKKKPKMSPSRPPSTPKLGKSFSYATEQPVEKSIYDADLDGRYVVSPQNSVDEEDDDEDFLSSEEEYFSGDDSESSDSEGTSMEESTARGSSWEQGFSSNPSGTYTDRSSWGSPDSKEAMKGPRAKGKKGQSSHSYNEEKKEDTSKAPSRAGSPRNSDVPLLSEVAKRLWCFFVIFNDPKNPEDNYIKQVEAVLEDLEFDLVEKLINLSLPEYAHEYLEQGTSTAGVTLGDVASPCAKALFYSYFFFLGRYEFSTEMDGIILHRSSDGRTVLIKATEHIIRTKEYQPGKELAPGAAEESIWATGEVIGEEEGYMASKFGDRKRPVYFKLTRNQEAYDNEVNCHSHIGLSSADGSPSHIVPLVNNYCAMHKEKKNRRYRMDIHDERFQTLNLYGGESIRLSDYPYALVYPYCDEGNLFDYFCHHGLNGVDEASDIGSQVGKALKKIHEKGVVHGNLSMRNIAMLLTSGDVATPHRTWAMSDFTNACQLQSGSTYMGSISHNGSAQFETGLMPPEMFVKLTAGETRIYQAYWEMVEKRDNIKVDKSVVEPYVNLESGSTFVLRCHYVPKEGKVLDKEIPTLPYQLVPARESTDVWCFGLLIFALCSGGRPLFASNMKTGHLLDYECIVSWNHEVAESNIYKYVEDPLAQDFLLHVLAPYEDRVDLTMETVLSHPFFTRASQDSSLLGKMIDERRQESAAHDRRRNQIMSERSKDDWLKTRTTAVHCWNFDMQRKIRFSSSEIVRKLVGKTNGALAMPCGFILLPYKLSAKNKKAKLAPTTKKDVERAERMGALLLALSKACYFAVHAKNAIEEAKDQQWTASKLIQSLILPYGDFETMKNELMKIAAGHIEAFRADPMSAVHKLVERHIIHLRAFFKDAGNAYLYLVDEHAGIPLANSACVPYPLEISASIADQFLTKALPFMHACTLVVRGVSGGISGLVRLIFEAAFPHIPPSWAQASVGLPHTLDEDLIIKEVKVLHESLASSSSSKTSYLGDDLQFVRDTCMRFDVRASFADMQRVESAGSALWTTKQGAAEIQEACQAYGFKEALEIQVALESKLRVQDQQIKKLQEDMERMKFRKELNLNVPDESPEPLSTPTKLKRGVDPIESSRVKNSSPTAAKQETVTESDNVLDSSADAAAGNVSEKPLASATAGNEDCSLKGCTSPSESVSSAEVFYDTKASKSFEEAPIYGSKASKPFEESPKTVLSDEDRPDDANKVVSCDSAVSIATDKSEDVQGCFSLD